MYVFISILAPVQNLGKWEMNILIKNPEIVFVADMTRNDAPALVITTQCEICCKGDPESNTVTAAIKDLQVRACPFLPIKRKGKITTVSSLFDSIAPPQKNLYKELDIGKLRENELLGRKLAVYIFLLLQGELVAYFSYI